MRPAGPAGRRKIDDDDLYFKALSLSSARSLFLLSPEPASSVCTWARETNWRRSKTARVTLVDRSSLTTNNFTPTGLLCCLLQCYYYCPMHACMRSNWIGAAEPNLQALLQVKAVCFWPSYFLGRTSALKSCMYCILTIYKFKEMGIHFYP